MENEILVKIGNSLNETRQKYGCNSTMRLMKNRIFKVKYKYNNRVVIHNDESGGDYTFSLNEVELLNSEDVILQITKPLIFNPNELDI